MIDAPSLLASHLFELASVWNVVRELTPSKQCMASRSSRLAVTFVLCDLVFKGPHRLLKLIDASMHQKQSQLSMHQ